MQFYSYVSLKSEILLQESFQKFGPIARLILPETRTVAIVQFHSDSDARQAFKSLAFRKFQMVPLFLEWAPKNVFDSSAPLLNSPLVRSWLLLSIHLIAIISNGTVILTFGICDINEIDNCKQLSQLFLLFVSSHTLLNSKPVNVQSKVCESQVPVLKSKSIPGKIKINSTCKLAVHTRWSR